MKADLRRHVWGLQAKLMHDPTSFDPIGSSVPIKHQSLSHPYDLLRCRVQHSPIFPRSFPVSRRRGTIGSVAGGVLAVSEAEEEPLVCIELSHLCNINLLIP